MTYTPISPIQYDLNEKEYWSSRAKASHKHYIESMMLIAEGD